MALPIANSLVFEHFRVHPGSLAEFRPMLFPASCHILTLCDLVLYKKQQPHRLREPRGTSDLLCKES